MTKIIKIDEEGDIFKKGTTPILCKHYLKPHVIVSLTYNEWEEYKDRCEYPYVIFTPARVVLIRRVDYIPNAKNHRVWLSTEYGDPDVWKKYMK